MIRQLGQILRCHLAICQQNLIQDLQVLRVKDKVFSKPVLVQNQRMMYHAVEDMIFRPHEPTQPVRRRKLHDGWLRLLNRRLLTATRALSQPTVIYRLLHLLIVKVRQQLSQHVNIGVLSCDGLGLRNNRRHLLYKLNLSL